MKTTIKNTIIMVKVQSTKTGFFISIPKSKAKLMELKGGEEFDAEYDRVNKNLVFIPIKKSQH